MSLDFDYSKVKQRNPSLCERGEYLTPELESAIWNCLSIGIGTLTAENIAEAVVRTKIIAALDDDTGRAKLAKMLPDFIGLATNVSTESRAKWMNRTLAQAVRVEQAAIDRQPSAGETR